MLAITDNALAAIRTLEETGGSVVRISAATTSLNGSGPAISVEMADAPEDDDEVLEADGAVVFLDPTTAAFDDKVLDAEVDADGIRFSIGEQE